MKSLTLRIALALFIATVLQAAPKLTLNASTVGPLQIAVGAVAPSKAIYAHNAGDGSMNLAVSSNQTWVGAVVKPLIICPYDVKQDTYCRPIEISFQTASLARGMYTAMLTVSDPNTVDAPQTITVTVQVGSSLPTALNFYLPSSGGSQSSPLSFQGAPTGQVSTQTGGDWLALDMPGHGSTDFSIPTGVTVTKLEGMADGDYQGSVDISGSSVADDNGQIPVNLTVTSDPILHASTTQIQTRVSTGVPPVLNYVSLSNVGMGTLELGDVTVTMQQGDGWLEASKDDVSQLVTVKVLSENLQPGWYQGEVSIASNAANSPLKIPVTAEIVAQKVPTISFHGAVNNATFAANEPLGQGTITALFGSQFTLGDGMAATDQTKPLPTKLGTTRVLVNGTAAPLWFVAYGQINFQMPYQTAPGQVIIQVERDGQLGNKISANVVVAEPRLLPFIDGYGIAVNLSDGSFAMPSSYSDRGFASHPVKRGDWIVVYAIGFGPTSPAVTTGAIVPPDYFYVLPKPNVTLGNATPFYPALSFEAPFVGLTPGYVGLYQVNVQIPLNAETGDAVPLGVTMPGVATNNIKVAIE